ncbi:glycosyltransferase [Patescibacteria group bacterium]|nr:glycosyltransferase [Patescibacteria group bacterium]
MISVIVPVRNEKAMLEMRLPIFSEYVRRGCEVLIVCSNSEDGSEEFVKEHPEFVFVNAGDRRRGEACNQAAEVAQGDILLILHVDTLLSGSLLVEIEQALCSSAVVGGGFRIAYEPVSNRNSRYVLTVSRTVVNLRTRYFKWFAGDQALFVRKSVFERVGGFRNLPMMEDQELVKRLKRQGRLVALPHSVWVSTRRYLGNGEFRGMSTIAFIHILYSLRVSPTILANIYKTFLPKER